MPGLIRISMIVMGFVLLPLLWLYPSYYNGSPLVFWDSSYYIRHALFPENPSWILWRPLGYSHFMALLPFGTNYFLFIYIKNFLISVFFYLVARHLKPRLSSSRIFLVLFLMSLSPLVYYSNFIMPDIFSACFILALASFHVAKDKSFKIFFGIVTILLVGFHSTNQGILLVYLFIRLIYSRRWVLTSLLILTSGIFSYTALMDDNPSGRLRASHMFLYFRLKHYGYVDQYLKKNCPNNKVRFCENPELVFEGWNFTTNNEIARSGGIRSLLPSVMELNREILLPPQMFYFLVDGLQQASWQTVTALGPMRLTPFERVDGFKQNSENSEFRVFEKQNLLGIPFELFNAAYRLYSFVVLSFAGLILLLLRRRLSRRDWVFLGVCLFGYILNAIVVGVFSELTDRYSSRIVWIFLFLPLLILMERGGLKSSQTKPHSGLEDQSS